MNKAEYASKLVEYSLEEQGLLMKTVQEGTTSPQLQTQIIGVRERNDALLKEVISSFGWPKISEFGAEASLHAWLLMQHSPDLDFQKKCLALMQELPNNEVNKYNQATTEDRISMRSVFIVKYGNNRFSEGGDFNVIPTEGSVEQLESNRSKIELEALDQVCKGAMERYKFNKVIFTAVDTEFGEIN